VARVFVTGGSGFIGGALVQRLVERGNDVVALARSDRSAGVLAGRGLRVVRGDALDEQSLAVGMKGCELVFHVAGLNSHCPEDPDLLMRVNVAGPQNAVRAAARAGVERVVLTSAAAAIGEARGTVGDERSPHRGTYLSAYDRSKHEGEHAAFAAGRARGVELVAVNPSSVQGPGRASGNGKLVIDYLNGSLKVFVKTHLSIVDIADCVEGHLLAAEHARDGERYLLNGATLTSEQALEMITAVSGLHERIRMVPAVMARTAAALAEGVCKRRGRPCPMCRARVRTILHGHRYDGSRATRDLGLEYRRPEATFARTIDWAVAEGLVTRPLPRRALAELDQRDHVRDEQKREADRPAVQVALDQRAAAERTTRAHAEGAGEPSILAGVQQHENDQGDRHDDLEGAQDGNHRPAA